MSTPTLPTDHDEYEALAVAWAVNALEPSDQAVFEAHRDGCERCARAAYAAFDIAAELAYGVPDVAPPARLRERVLAGALPHAPKASRTPDRSIGHSARCAARVRRYGGPRGETRPPLSGLLGPRPTARPTRPRISGLSGPRPTTRPTGPRISGLQGPRPRARRTGRRVGVLSGPRPGVTRVGRGVGSVVALGPGVRRGGGRGVPGRGGWLGRCGGRGGSGTRWRRRCSWSGRP